MPEQKQHVDITRKLKLRKDLLQKAGKLSGAYYIPFIGEGDIADALYKGHPIYGADNDSAMVKAAQAKLPEACIVKADCDQYPFTKDTATFSLADFGSYSYPYDSFRTFFKGAKIGSQCVLFFTDGQRQAIIRTGHYRTPDGVKHRLKTKTEKREVYNFYFNKTLLPWFKDYIKPWHITEVTKYLRGPNQMYWGVIIHKGNGDKNGRSTIEDKSEEKKPYKFDSIKKAEYLKNISNGHTRGYAATLAGIGRQTVYDHIKKDKGFGAAISEAEDDAIAKVENALFEAANSGNVTAIQVFLYNRNPKRWADRRSVQLSGEGGGPVKVDIDAKGKLISLLSRLASRREKTEGTKPTK